MTAAVAVYGDTVYPQERSNSPTRVSGTGWRPWVASGALFIALFSVMFFAAQLAFFPNDGAACKGEFFCLDARAYELRRFRLGLGAASVSAVAGCVAIWASLARHRMVFASALVAAVVALLGCLACILLPWEPSRADLPAASRTHRG